LSNPYQTYQCPKSKFKIYNKNQFSKKDMLPSICATLSSQKNRITLTHKRSNAMKVLRTEII